MPDEKLPRVRLQTDCLRRTSARIEKCSYGQVQSGHGESSKRCYERGFQGG